MKIHKIQYEKQLTKDAYIIIFVYNNNKLLFNK